MDGCVLNEELLPELRWNTHLACMQKLAQAAGHGLDLADVAGITGLAFRTSLCREATAAGLHHSYAWEPSFRVWLDALGLDADLEQHRTELPCYPGWIERQHTQAAACLRRGFPVLFWDNAGFNLVIGERDGRYLAGPMPAQLAHPIWASEQRAERFLARTTLEWKSDREPVELERDELTPVLDHDAFCGYIHGVPRFDRESALTGGLWAAAAELLGKIEFPRFMDDFTHVFEPRFGTVALARLLGELKLSQVNPFGLILFVQSQAEARRLGKRWLDRVISLVDPQYKGRLEQAAEFLERIIRYWQPACAAYSPPLDEKQQMLPSRLETCREAVYQVMQTENTMGRLLVGVVREMFDPS